MKGMSTSLKSVDCLTGHEQPKGNQVAIKQPVRKLNKYIFFLSVKLAISEVAYSEYFLNYLIGNTKE